MKWNWSHKDMYVWFTEVFKLKPTRKTDLTFLLVLVSFFLSKEETFCACLKLALLV